MTEVSIDTLHALLEANFETGALAWKERGLHLFTDNSTNTADQQRRTWNTRYAGQPAFTAQDAYGYHVGAIFDKLLKAHRILWAMKYGEWPVGGIDHVDGDNSNNAISNLRLADQSINMKNASMSSRNKSGCMGVCWIESRSLWEVRANINKKAKFIGRFKNKSDAIIARKQAEKDFGYHPNHGRRKAA